MPDDTRETRTDGLPRPRAAAATSTDALTASAVAGRAEPADEPSGLVWPPVEADLEDWDVIPLGETLALVAPVITPPAGRVEAPRAAVAGSQAREDAATPRPPRAGSTAAAGSSTDTRASSAPGGPGSATRIVATGLALLAAAAIGFAAGRSLRPADAPAPSSEAHLFVESAPGALRVLVDGTERGRTPLSVDLPAGSYRVEVEGGSGRMMHAVSVAGGDQASCFFSFAPVTPAPAAGARADDRGRPVGNAGSTSRGEIAVDSTPPGATVVVAGEARGRTPITVSGLAPGYHDVLVSAGGREVVKRVRVSAGQVAQLHVVLDGQ